MKRFTKTLVALSKDVEPVALLAITPQVYATTPADNRLRTVVLVRWQISGLATSLDAAKLETLVGDCPAFGTGLILGLSRLPPVVKLETSDPRKLVLACFPEDGNRTLISEYSITRQTGLSDMATLSELHALRSIGMVAHGQASHSWYRY